MKNREVSLMLFYNDKNEILLQDRELCSKSGEDWGFFGGGIEEGESPEEAVKREIKEELNITLDNVDEPIGIVENNYFNTMQNCSINVKRFVFVKKHNGEKIESLEGAAYSWFVINKAKELRLVPGDMGVLNLAENYLK